MSVPDDVLTRLPLTDYEVLRSELRTGDLALCSGDSFFSRAVRWATRSPWSHVALVVRLDEIDRVMLLESVAKIGVRTVALSRFIAQDSAGRRPYPGRIVMARHTEFAEKATPERLKAMSDFAADGFGAPFNGVEMLRIAARIGFSRFGLRTPTPLHPKGDYICSEYVGACLERVGIKIPWDGRGFIGPADFARDADVHAIARVST